jgi:hypothetical protein
MLLRNIALASALAVGAPAVAAAAPEAPVAVETVKVQAPKAAQDSTNYAQRESQDKKTADYQGGDVLVIGITGGALVVLLFLLLVLA